jgi:hydroxymethylbilane synthase
MTVVRVGTRGSALALWQAHYVVSRLRELAPGARIQLVEIASAGDEVTDVPLVQVAHGRADGGAGGDHWSTAGVPGASTESNGFFTATLEQALLDGHVDVAVHSYKDLPVEVTRGLTIAAVPPRGPVADALCGRRPGDTVESLPRGATVGTCSARREAQLRALRPDLDIRPVRGNVPTRLRTLNTGRLDAVVLAKAGLVRLGLESAITQVLPMRSMLPAPAQGALAVQMRSGEPELAPLLAGLNDVEARRAATAERTLLHALGGGCSAPVGAWARLDGARFTLTAGVFALDGSRAIRTTVMHEDPQTLGMAAARHLIQQGAADVLAPILAARTVVPPQRADHARRGPRVVGA